MFNLTLSPNQAEIIAKPGATISHLITVTNNSGDTLFLTTSVKPWLPGPTPGQPDFRLAPNNPDIIFFLNNPDLKLGQTFQLAPRQTKQLTLGFNVASPSPPKDFYYTFFVSQDPAVTLNSTPNQSVSLAQIGSNILLSVSDTQYPKLEAKLTEISVTPLFKDSFLTPVTFNAKMANLSNHFSRFTGNIAISKNNKPFTSLQLYPDTVLVGEHRPIRCFVPPANPSLPPSSPTGCQLPPPLWPGFYTATFTLDQSPNSSFSRTFFVAPYTLILPLLIIITLIFLLRRQKPKV
ncbi:MAG: hypothetical protein WC686_01960 [Candidatus Shapirobacteria bacterium]|jgi:hypothetical protein